MRRHAEPLASARVAVLDPCIAHVSRRNAGDPRQQPRRVGGVHVLTLDFQPQVRALTVRRDRRDLMHPVLFRRMLEARRLRILSIIARTRAYTTNETALLESLHSEGFQISFDRLRTDLAWLSEQHAVQLKCGALWGIYLTQPGLDASQGSVWIPGIQKPEATTEQEQD